MTGIWAQEQLDLKQECNIRQQQMGHIRIYLEVLEEEVAVVS